VDQGEAGPNPPCDDSEGAAAWGPVNIVTTTTRTAPEPAHSNIPGRDLGGFDHQTTLRQGRPGRQPAPDDRSWAACHAGRHGASHASPYSRIRPAERNPPSDICRGEGSGARRPSWFEWGLMFHGTPGSRASRIIGKGGLRSCFSLIHPAPHFAEPARSTTLRARCSCQGDHLRPLARTAQGTGCRAGWPQVCTAHDGRRAWRGALAQGQEY